MSQSDAGARLPSSWLNEAANAPVIDQHARRLTSFIDAMADGRIEESELKQQEQRLVEIMREVEPQLSPELHARVTELLCELTAFDVMQCLYALHSTRPATQFRG